MKMVFVRVYGDKFVFVWVKIDDCKGDNGGRLGVGVKEGLKKVIVGVKIGV